MTREELKKIAKRYAHDELKDNHGDVEDIVASAFIEGAKWADAHPNWEAIVKRLQEEITADLRKDRWISVEDELPPKDKAYLAFWQHLGVTKYRYVKAGAKVSRTFSEHITHWMPLPSVEHLKEKGGEE